MTDNIKDLAVLSVLGLDVNVKELSPEGIYKNLAKVKQLTDVLKKQQESLREEAFKKAEDVGEKDEKGSSYVRLANGDWFKKEARTSVKVKEDIAVPLFEEKGLEKRLTPDLSRVDPKKLYQLIKLHSPELDEDVDFKLTDLEVEQAYYAGEINDEELQKIIERKITYALKLKPNK